MALPGCAKGKRTPQSKKLKNLCRTLTTFRHYSSGGGGGPFHEHRRGIGWGVTGFLRNIRHYGGDLFDSAPEVEAESGSRVVDNATEDRFESDGYWGTSSYGRSVYDED